VSVAKSRAMAMLRNMSPDSPYVAPRRAARSRQQPWPRRRRRRRRRGSSDDAADTSSDSSDADSEGEVEAPTARDRAGISVAEQFRQRRAHLEGEGRQRAR
jgi:hypothetical protein